jgi:hypothetical protein
MICLFALNSMKSSASLGVQVKSAQSHIMALLARNKFAGKRDALIQRPIGVDNQLRLRYRLERGFEALIEIERAVCGRVIAGGLVAIQALDRAVSSSSALDGAEGRTSFRALITASI